MAIRPGWAGLDLGLLLGAYAAAVIWPGPGLWLRKACLGEVASPGGRVTVTLPLALLALLLFNAGLGVQTARLKGLLHRPGVLCTGLAANLLVPLAALFCLSCVLPQWYNPDEVQNLLVGLALVVAMPVAGSAAAWTQKADGDLSLSLGLVLGSTLLSPLTTPLALRAAGYMAGGDGARALHGLAAAGAGSFLVMGVALPALLGVLVHRLAGEDRVTRARPHLKRVATVALVLLCYANAAVALPSSVADPAWGFLALLVGAVVGLCGLTFAAGWALAWVLKADIAQQRSLMFGLGMNNNGTGLVLAGTALAAYPRVMLPLLVYNLLQHLMAGAVAARLAPAAEPIPVRQADARLAK